MEDVINKGLSSSGIKLQVLSHHSSFCRHSVVEQEPVKPAIGSIRAWSEAEKTANQPPLTNYIRLVRRFDIAMKQRRPLSILRLC